MEFFVCFALVINIVLLYIYVAVAQEIVNSNICWNANGDCYIEANITRDTKTFLVNFECSDNGNSLVTNVNNFRKIVGVETIELNGCNATQNSTIGVEYVDDPISVTHLTIYLFKMKMFYSKHLHKFKALVTIKVIDNRFEEIINESFENITSVETVVISNNNLKVIAPYALLPLINLKNLTLIDPNLSIEELNLTFCYSMKHLQLQVFAYEWQILPRSVETLQITNTKLIFASEAFNVEDCIYLIEITISKSQFDELPYIRSTSLRTLNLTQNNLHQFPNTELPNLETIDVSGNKLQEINDNSFKSMKQLRKIFAGDNRIAKISKKAFDSNEHLEIIQISGNRLKSMEFTNHLVDRPQQMLQMFIDDNPWSCTWVLNVSSEQPTIFAVFHYSRYTNKINVHGLNCLYDKSDEYTVYEMSSKATESTPIATERAPITSTILPYPENIEISYRRNPKNTALITLIILVVGVAFLFFLLYLHIKCRENTVEPFYRSLPYDTHQMSDRVDIIRRNLPPTDYEAPIAARDADSKEVIYEQIPEKGSNYERIPEKFIVHEGFDDVNSVLSYK